MEKTKAVLSLSGGMDSATLLAWMTQRFDEVECVGFKYGSKHNAYEAEAAVKLADHYGAQYRLVDLSQAFATLGFRSNLLQGQGDIPEGHYTDASMERTVVPGRNIIFLSLLAGCAWSVGASVVGIGIHQGDHAIYPDCRESFFLAMQTALNLGTDGRISLIAPFLGGDKKEILDWGLKNGVPYHMTRTCYKDQVLACGKCGSCTERLEAFEKCGITDPVWYE